MAKHFSDKEVAGIHPTLVSLADSIREMVGEELVVTSGKRAPGKAGVKNSAHESGLALDFRSQSWEKHFRIVEAAIMHGIKRIGVYHNANMMPTHVHIDIDATKPTPRLWIDISQ